MLGKLLREYKPEIANELSNLMEGETDLSKLHPYLTAFCNLKTMPVSFIQGALFKHSLIENRRIFVAVILSIYRPHTRRLRISLANLLKYHKQHIKDLIDESLVHYKVYPSFRNEVDEIVSKIKGV